MTREVALIGLMGAALNAPIMAWGLYTADPSTVIAGCILAAVGPLVRLTYAWCAPAA